ncbi:4-alpha-glucanotransferase [Aridibaculum aurantiacum]|uniref:4-alpha-glucanotransferase n=1 Tax=Aridibaculum aurantiacum TaxID=2810307 RepID=UPI001F613A44|nr:4-alpha-glucanotransferase [Aridibaculum aurantiacum]
MSIDANIPGEEKNQPVDNGAAGNETGATKGSGKPSVKRNNKGTEPLPAAAEQANDTTSNVAEGSSNEVPQKKEKIKAAPKKAAAKPTPPSTEETPVANTVAAIPTAPEAVETVPVAKKAAVKSTSSKAPAEAPVPKKAAPKKATITPEPVKEEVKLAVKKATKKVEESNDKKPTGKAAKPTAEPARPAAKKRSAPAAPQVTAEAGTTTSPTVNQENVKGLRRIVFQLRFYTHHGQSLSVSGNHPLLGNGDPEKAFPLQFLDRDNWYGILEVPAGEVLEQPISYNYLLHEAGNTTAEWGADKLLNPTNYDVEEVLLIDSWNDSSFIENSFYTEPFKQVLLRENFTPYTADEPATYTHLFRVKAPLLKQGQVMCLLGSGPQLGEWNEAQPILMQREDGEDYFQVKLDLTGISFPIVYKYGVYDLNNWRFVRYEDGNNRIIFDNISPKKLTVVSDGFAVLPNNGFRGAGVAIPVFSLRSHNSFGVGEFNDMKLLVDWAKQVGLKLVQILPVNDTTATHTSADSYPYAAISAFALHPQYLHIPAVIRNADSSILSEVEDQRIYLQQQENIDYEGVMALKWRLLRQIFPAEKEETFGSDNFNSFFQSNKHWLVPYAAFSYFRDQNGTADFSTWTSHSSYNEQEVSQLAGDPTTAPDDVAIHYFIQYHLHLQLQAAAAYAHANGIIVKGDIPIGIYRNSCDAWQQPELYNMEMQAGAPPDDFAVKGQNWGFPTYNWQRMQQDGFNWWKLRFEQMSYYFDAFRIDHILGFFRIWSIPMHAVEGILGHFVPALPIHINELVERGIHVDKQRFVQPYITDEILDEIFGNEQYWIKDEFLQVKGNGEYLLKEQYNTQRKIEDLFNTYEKNPHNLFLKLGLFDLISNVLMFEVEGSGGQQFHFRISMEDTRSFQALDLHTQQQLRELYINYFYRRQDNFWEREAMQKLPELKRSTNMLICGEDLGMVPDCVPGVMKRLSILSLEIQRMPKDPTREFFHPGDAPYLSVVTPSTHDMSTIRGWWEEDRARTQLFFNQEMGQWGEAPYYCEPWINKAIVLQHFYSPAMWSIFQLQDLLGSSEKLRRANPNDERINIPADPKHYWRYRLHFPLETLLEEDLFNTDLRNTITVCGRS